MQLKNLTTLVFSALMLGGLVLIWLLKLPEGGPRVIAGSLWAAAGVLLWVLARRAYNRK